MTIDKETLIKLATKQVEQEINKLYAYKHFHTKVRDAIWKRINEDGMISKEDLEKFFDYCEDWSGLKKC